ncbi:hypothetical protein Tco_0579141 [Tanacetum coccineum]
MWSSTRIVAPTPSSNIIQRPISTNFRIKGTHMQMIWDNEFDGRIRSDPYRHVADFFKISNLFQYGENLEEAVMLRTFPFSLCEEAKIYFHQLDNETLVEAWVRLKEMLRICYRHGLTKGTIVHIFYHGLDGPTQGILDAEGIFLYNTPNEAFKILEDKVIFQLDFSGGSQNSPKPKTIISSGGNNINLDLSILVDKFKALATKIDSEFLIIRTELKEMQDGRRDNHALDDYLKDDTLMCEPNEANYVQRYHGGYHDHEPKNSYSYPNHNSHPSQYYEFTETSTKEMMRECMASQTKANECMKNQDCIVYIPYTQEKVFKYDEISNHVGDKELISFVGIGNEVSKGNIEDTENSKRPNVSPLLASISVLINGSPSKDFKKERGLRKGDHLSSLLFLLVAEALQVAIMEACSKELFKGSSGLKVNISKSRLIGVGVPTVNVEQVAEPLIELSTKCRLCISIWVSVALAPKTNVCWKSGYGDFSLKKMHFGILLEKFYGDAGRFDCLVSTAENKGV